MLRIWSAAQQDRLEQYPEGLKHFAVQIAVPLIKTVAVGYLKSSCKYLPYFPGSFSLACTTVDFNSSSTVFENSILCNHPIKISLNTNDKPLCTTLNVRDGSQMDLQFWDPRANWFSITTHFLSKISCFIQIQCVNSTCCDCLTSSLRHFNLFFTFLIVFEIPRGSQIQVQSQEWFQLVGMLHNKLIFCFFGWLIKC